MVSRPSTIGSIASSRIHSRLDKTLEGLRGQPGSDEGKVFNPVRGLRKEIEDEAETAPVLAIAEGPSRPDLKDMENRNTTPGCDRYACCTGEGQGRSHQGAKDSGLSARAFGVYSGT